MNADFLKAEMRCGYLVNDRMKAIWKVQLDILEEVIRICRKYDISFYLMYGSMLGAVRHRGYIPWDDDLDIGMFREDFDRFLEVAQKELPSHLFLQTSSTEKGYYFSFAKIKDSNTTALDKVYTSLGAKINYGIFVDVFPLDAYPEKDVESAKRYFGRIDRLQSFLRRSYWGSGRKSVMAKALDIIARIVGWRVLACLRDWLLRRHKAKGAFWCIGDLADARNERMIFKAKWFESAKWVPFEYLEVPIPSGAEEVLTHSYGDWHKFVMGGATHEGNIEFDPYRPYSEVLEERLRSRSGKGV